MEKLLLLGDSLTAGHPGVGYPEMLARIGCPVALVAEGSGGSTLREARWRLNPLLQTHRPRFLMVEIGANDVLIPMFQRRGGPWKTMARNLQFKGSVPMTTPEAFRQAFEEMLDGMPEGLQVFLATIACLGEVLGSDMNRARNQYNTVIRNLAEKHRTGLVDVARAFDGELRNLDKPSAYLLNRHVSVFVDTLITAPEAGADYLSKRRGLHLTVDGVHLNSRGARLYAETVLAALGNRTIH
jgi:lysophospholipase L1-like esterase